MLRIGQPVAYRATKEDVLEIERLIEQGVFANRIEEGSYIAAVITTVWAEDLVNVKLIHDGDVPNWWKTSVHVGDTPGCILV